jgi:hypothetical protein
MQGHLAACLDISAACLKQLVNIILRNAITAEFDFNGRQQAVEPTGRHANPYTVDIGTGNPFGLLDCMSHRQFGLFDICDTATRNASALALTRAQYEQFAAIGLPGNEGGNFRRANIYG